MHTKCMDISIRNSLVVSAEFMPRLVRERERERQIALDETYFHHSKVKHIARKDYHNNNITSIYILVVYHDLNVYIATYYVQSQKRIRLSL